MKESKMSRSKTNKIQTSNETYITIEKLSQQVHQLIEITYNNGLLTKKILREDIPEIVRAKFMEALWNAPCRNKELQ